MASKYDRSISLICPTCAADQFDYDKASAESARVYLCTSCNMKFTHQEMLDLNSNRIDSELSALKKGVIEDLEKSIKKSLGGLKGWKAR